MIRTYTVQELVPILKRKEKTIRNYIKNQELKACWLGNGFVVKENDVEDFLKKRYIFDYKEVEKNTEN